MSGSAVVIPVAPRLQRDRYLVPDVARGVAILAMLIAHAGPIMTAQPAATVFLQTQLNDLASPLFATTMGAAAAIVLAKAGSNRGTVRAVIVQNILRGLILVLLGLLLETWGSWIAIVLSFLGIVLAIGTPLLLLGTRALIVVLAVVALVGAPLNAAVLAATGPLMTAGERSPASFLLEWLFLSPHYRVTNLLPWFLFGALLFRIQFGSIRTGWLMLAVAVPAWWLGPLWRGATGQSSVSGSYLDSLHDVGLVLFTLGLIILLAGVRAGPAATVVRAVFLPFRAIGSLSLSLYVFQVGVVALMNGNGILYGSTDPVAWLVLVLGVPLVGLLWWRFLGKGPLEWLIGVVTGRYRPRRRAAVEAAGTH